MVLLDFSKCQPLLGYLMLSSVLFIYLLYLSVYVNIAPVSPSVFTQTPRKWTPFREEFLHFCRGMLSLSFRSSQQGNTIKWEMLLLFFSCHVHSDPRQSWPSTFSFFICKFPWLIGKDSVIISPRQLNSGLSFSSTLARLEKLSVPCYLTHSW